jgi:hypothetical protein
MQGYFVLVWELCRPEIQFACVHLHHAGAVVVMVMVIFIFVSTVVFKVLRLCQVRAGL